MYLMSTDHFDKLFARKSDAIINELYEFGKPSFDAYITQYRKNVSDDANYQMYTLRFQNLLSDLSSTLARRWDIQILGVFDVITPEYKSLMPNNRIPFQSGPYEIRINSVKSLSDQLLQYPSLSALQKEVNDFHALLLLTRTQQQGFENTSQVNSAALENARVALAQAMHSIFGKLMGYYYLDLAMVESYYELRYLRRTPGSGDENKPLISEQIVIPQGSAATALVGKVSAGSSVRVTNIGAAILTVFPALNGNTPIPANGGYSVSPEQSVIFQTLLGDTLIRLLNDTDPFDGKALVELLS
jgi:hypothetical protein